MKPQKFRDVDKVLRRLGYLHERTAGSHYVYFKAGFDPVVVPRHGHGIVSAGTMRSILTKAGIDEDEFRRLK